MEWTVLLILLFTAVIKSTAVITTTSLTTTTNARTQPANGNSSSSISTTLIISSTQANASENSNTEFISSTSTEKTFPGNSTTKKTETAGVNLVNDTGNLTSQSLPKTLTITGKLITEEEVVENSSSSLNFSEISQSELTYTINISYTGITEAQPTVSSTDRITGSTESGKTTGPQKVLADKNLTAVAGGSVSFSFKYKFKYKEKVKFCCKLIWIICKYIVRSDFTNPGGKISITDNQSQQVFTVTMEKLQMKDSGTYWCGVRREPQGANWHIQVIPAVKTTTSPTTTKDANTRVNTRDGDHAALISSTAEAADNSTTEPLNSTSIEFTFAGNSTINDTGHGQSTGSWTSWQTSGAQNLTGGTEYILEEYESLHWPFPGNSTTKKTETAGVNPDNVTANLTSRPLHTTLAITGKATTQKEAVGSSTISLNSSVISHSELTSPRNISSTGITAAQPTTSTTDMMTGSTENGQSTAVITTTSLATTKNLTTQPANGDSSSSISTRLIISSTQANAAENSNTEFISSTSTEKPIPGN